MTMQIWEKRNTSDVSHMIQVNETKKSTRNEVFIIVLFFLGKIRKTMFSITNLYHDGHMTDIF